MQLQQLIYVLEVAKVGSMNKAAQNLFISQPNLSNSIANLEKELGIYIFNRTSRGVEVTQDGKVLIKYARSILGQVNHLKSIYSEEGSKEEITVLEVSQSKSLYLSEAICKIYNTTPQALKVTMNIAPLSDVIKNVYDTKSELGFIVLSKLQKNIMNKRLKGSKLEFTSLQKSKVCVVVGRDSPLAERSSIRLQELLDYIFIDYLDESSSPLKYSADLSEIWSDSPKQTLYVNDLESLRNLLHSLPSYSFDLLMNKTYLEGKELVCIALEEQIEVIAGYIKRRNEILSPKAEELIKEVTKYYGYNKKL